MPKKLSLSLLCFLLLKFVVSQTPSNNYSILVLDFSNSDVTENLKMLGNNNSFKSIYIKNASENKQLTFLGNFSYLSCLKIENSSTAAISSIFASLRQGVFIDTLEFIYANNDGTDMNKTSLKAKNIIFDDCDKKIVIDFMKCVLNQHYIISLKINYCSLDAIPNSITKFSNLSNLNLNDNLITSLPSGFTNLKSLNSLSLTGNYFEKIPDDFSKLKLMHINHLEVDKMDEDSENMLKKYLPKTNISFVEAPNLIPEDNKVDIGELKTISSSNKILSNAYLIYPKIMASPLSRTTIDSIRFEDRFNDTNYLYRIDTRNYKYYSQFFKIYRHRTYMKGKIAFSFLPPSRKWYQLPVYGNHYFFLTYREMEVFRNYIWILDDTISKASFNKIIKDTIFSDIRVHYNPTEKNFELILKYGKTFLVIKAFPINPDKKNLDGLQNQYTSIYSIYIKKLNIRGNTYNKNIIKNCNLLYATDRRYKQAVWQEMKGQMSPEERLMNQDEWLRYYASITSNEMTALLNATPSNSLVERALLLKKYVNNPIYETIIRDTVISQTININFTLTDRMGNSLPIISFFIINKSKMTYRYYPNQASFGRINLNINSADDYVIIGFQSDNSVSMANLTKANGILSIPADHVPLGLASIQQIISTLEL